MKTLLKKAGIVVAATTAALLAVSPLAFAGTAPAKAEHHGPAGDCNVSQNTGAANQTVGIGVLNLNDVISDVNVAIPICDNNVNVQVIPILSPNTQSNS